MTRVCVLGNSHIVALKLGWPRLEQEQQTFQLSFFGAGQPYIKDLALVGRSITPTSEKSEAHLSSFSEGKRKVDLDDYDAVLLVGLGLSALGAAQVYKRHRLVEHVRARELIISPACLETTYADFVSASGAVSWATKIRSVTRTLPIAIIPHPIPSEAILRSPNRLDIWGNLDIRRLLFDVYIRAIGRVARDFGVTILEPLGEALNGWLTKEEYGVGSVSLTEDTSIPHVVGDYSHMNAAYGALVLSKALPRLLL